jgi:hypothetical protein
LLKITHYSLAKKLVPQFSYTFEGKIWKTCTDEQNSLLALEIRNDITRSVSFSILDAGTCKIIKNNLRVKEPWWISLESIRWPVLYLRIFPDEQNPADINLLAFDIEKEQTRWIAEHFEPVVWEETDIRGRNTLNEKGEFNSINILTGKITYPDAVTIGSFSQDDPVPGNIKLFYPVQYFEGEENFNIIKEFLGREKIYPSIAIEYLEHGEYAIIGFFSKKDPGLSHHLLVTDSGGNIVYDKQCDAGLKGIGVELFFIMNGTLIFTIEKTTLAGIRLV